MSDNYVVEIVQFKLAKGVDEKYFLAASDEVFKELEKQKGFVHRELLKNEKGNWIDLVQWTSQEEADQAQKSVMKIPVCLKFFKMINQKSVKMLHYERVKNYDIT